MSKIDFKVLVEHLLSEQEADIGPEVANPIITAINAKLPKTPINADTLRQIYNFFRTTGTYYTGDQLLTSKLLEYVPVVDLIAFIHKGAKFKARDAAKNLNINDFYIPVRDNISQNINKLKPIQAGYEFQDGEIKRIYGVALDMMTSNVLVQNVWPGVQNLTIVNSITKILQNRLTSLEQIKLGFIAPTKDLGNFDHLMLDTINNLQKYSSGSKQYSKQVTNILTNVNILPKDLVEITTYTVELCKLLLTNKFKNMAETVIANSLTNENIYNFAKNGKLTYFINNEQQVSRETYTLNVIEKLNVDPGNELIKVIKSISSGIRVKDPQFRKLLSTIGGGIMGRLAAAIQVGQAITALAGHSLYGGTR